jgi:DnaK suppressor protein
MSPEKTTVDVESARARLTARRAELHQRLERVDADQRHLNDPLSADFAEAANQTSNDEVLGAIGETVRAEIGDIDAALLRMTAGRYGICSACGKPIESARLAAVPYSLRCAACAD